MLNMKSEAFKRVSALFLAMVMLLTGLPTNVFAEGMQKGLAEPKETVVSVEEESIATEPKAYKVTFEPNGGSGEMEAIEVEEGELFELPENEFEAPKGQEFKAWGLEVEDPDTNEVETKKYKVKDEITVEEDVTFKAQWQEKESLIEKVSSLLGKKDKEEATPKAVVDEEKAFVKEPTEELTPESAKDENQGGNSNPKSGPKETTASEDSMIGVTNSDLNRADTDEEVVGVAKSNIQITNFQNFWVEDPSNSLADFSKEQTMQLNWSLTSDKDIKPEEVKIRIPAKFLIEEETQNYATLETPTPKAQFLEDGSLDTGADYGVAKYVYYYDSENPNDVIVTNVKNLGTAEKGTMTVTYSWGVLDPKNDYQRFYQFLLHKDSFDINSIIPSIQTNEVIQGEELSLSFKKQKEITIEEARIRNNITNGEEIIYKWDDDWGDDIKPENPEDYIYLEQRVDFTSQTLNREVRFTLENIGSDLVEPIAYKTTRFPVIYPNSLRFANEITKQNFYYKINNNRIVIGDITKDGLEKENNYLQWYEKLDEFGQIKIFSSEHYQAHGGFYILSKVPKSLIDDGKEHSLVTNVTARIEYLHEENKFVEKTFSTSVPYKYEDPVGFSLKENSYHLYNNNNDSESVYVNESLDFTKHFNNGTGGSGIVLTANVVKETYDPKFGAADNPEAYGKKEYEAELIFDYNYLAKNYSEELGSEEFSIDDVFIMNLNLYNYDQANPSKPYTYVLEKDKNILTPVKIYLRKASTGEWVEAASYDTKNGYAPSEVNYVSKINPKESTERYSSAKLVIRTSYPGIELTVRPNMKVVAGEKIKKQLLEKDIKTNESVDLIIRQKGTGIIRNSKGERIGIKSSLAPSDPISRTDELDQINYGERMAHTDRSYYITAYYQKLNQKLTKEIQKITNDKENKEFSIPVEVLLREETRDNGEGNYLELNNFSNSVFYELLPLGVYDVKDVVIKDQNYEVIDSSYELINNWRNTNRTLLKITSKEIGNEGRISNDKKYQIIRLTYNMLYSWDSYKDYGSKLYSYSAFDSQKEGLTDGQEGEKDFGTTIHDKLANEALNNLVEGSGQKRFLYTSKVIDVVGDTIATTSLSKHVRTNESRDFVIRSTVNEGETYSYKLRYQNDQGGVTKDLIIFDSLENYVAEQGNDDFGAKQWSGVLESIDTTQAEMKGADPVIYISTIENLSIPENRDLTDSSVWTKYNEGDDLTKAKAVAIDLRKATDGTPFKLENEQSVNVILNMSALWGQEAKDQIGGKALNRAYAVNTLAAGLAHDYEDKLIKTGNTSVEIVPVLTTAQIKASKAYVDQKGEPLELKGNDFTFQLKEGDTVLQTVKNDTNGKITFKPIQYNSWDVGEHTYTIEEVKGDDNKIVYDTNVETVTVKVKRQGASDLVATVVYDENGANFTNTEKGTAQVQLIKYGEDKNTPLPGAEFTLYHKDGTPVLDEENNGIVLVTAEEGKSQTIELETGDYYLIETKAPAGHTISDEKHEFTITDEHVGTLVTLEYLNDSLVVLPSTGGRGTKALIFGGIMFGVITGAILYTANKKKRRGQLTK